MKIKLKKTFIFPLLMLALSLAWIHPAEAGVWETSQTELCYIQVLVQDAGGGWQWGTVQGTQDGCAPQRWSCCIPIKCAASVAPVE